MLSKEELYDLYITQNLPIKEIISQYNIPNATLYRLLKKYNINSSRSAFISKEELYDLYITQNLPQWKIGEMFNCDRKAVARLCKKYNIEKEYITKEDVTNVFNTSNSYTEMAKKLNTTSDTCSKYCQKYGLKYDFSVKDKYYKDDIIDKIKELYEEKILSCRDIEKVINVPRRIIQSIVKENNFKHKSISSTIKIAYDELYDLYVNKKLSSITIGNMYNVSYSVIVSLLHKYDIDINTSYEQSNNEIEIETIIKNHDIKYHLNDREVLNGKEIDIFIPEKNIGIEFNGNYWHNEYKKPIKYHQEKSLLAEEKGIFLYHIFEYEWDLNKGKILNQLNNLLGINQTKIYARKCEIKEVDNPTKSQFLKNNHLQGNDKSNIKLGLYYNNELVSLMTFCKSRFNSNYEWELSRFCSKADCNVVGGASKLFKYFVNNYNPTSIISYSNIAHTKGTLYKTLGFGLDNISSPNYVWCKGHKLLSRYQCQKHKLIEQGYQGNSESDIMHNRKYYRIYDCGNKVWVWNKKEKL